MTGTRGSIVRVWLGRARPERVTAAGVERLSMSVYGTGTRKTAVLLHRSSACGVPVVEDNDHATMDEHMVAWLGETDPAWSSVADVIVVRADGFGGAMTSPTDVHSRCPGCLVIALGRPGDGCVVETRTGWRLRMVPGSSGAFAGDIDVAAYASLVHAWMVSGRSLAALDTGYVAGPGRFGAGRRVMRISAARVSPGRQVVDPEMRWRAGA